LQRGGKMKKIRTLPKRIVLIMNYTIAQTLSPQHFKRRFGVERETAYV